MLVQAERRRKLGLPPEEPKPAQAAPPPQVEKKVCIFLCAGGLDGALTAAPWCYVKEQMTDNCEFGYVCLVLVRCLEYHEIGMFQDVSVFSMSY